MNAVRRELAANAQPVIEQDAVYEALRPTNTDWLSDAATHCAFTGDVDYLRTQIARHTGLKVEAAA